MDTPPENWILHVGDTQYNIKTADKQKIAEQYGKPIVPTPEEYIKKGMKMALIPVTDTEWQYFGQKNPSIAGMPFSSIETIARPLVSQFLALRLANQE